MLRWTLIGEGRAGGSLVDALHDSSRWKLQRVYRRGDDLANATRDTDLVVIAVGDAAIRSVATAIQPANDVVVAHLSGASGLDVLVPHARRASLHPLVSLPSREVGARRIRGAWMALAGDPLITSFAEALDGRSFTVADDDRSRYHATASIAANHLVALLGQVERLAVSVGVPAEAFTDLALGALDNARQVGPAAALTGPVARGDWSTIERHLAALPEEERAAYLALAQQAARLAERTWPPTLPTAEAINPPSS